MARITTSKLKLNDKEKLKIRNKNKKFQGFSINMDRLYCHAHWVCIQPWRMLKLYPETNTTCHKGNVYI